MILYALIILVPILLFKNKYKLICILLGLISAFRVDAGYDYGSYIQLINNGFYIALFEPFPLFIAAISDYLQSPQIYIAINSVIFVFAIYMISKESEFKYLFIFMVLCLPYGYFESFSIIRQCTASAFFMLIYYNLRIKYNKFLIIIFTILMLLSHKSAPYALVLMIIGYFNYIYVPKRITYMLSPIIVIYLYFFFDLPSFSGELEISSDFGSKAIILIVAIFIIAKIIDVISYKSYSDSDKLIESLSLIGVVILIGLFNNGYFVTRFSLYFTPFIFLYSSKVFYKNGIISRFFITTVCILSFISIFYYASLNLDFDFMNNYKFFPSECLNCDIRKGDGIGYDL